MFYALFTLRRKIETSLGVFLQLLYTKGKTNESMQREKQFFYLFTVYALGGVPVRFRNVSQVEIMRIGIQHTQL